MTTDPAAWGELYPACTGSGNGLGEGFVEL